MVLQCLLQHVDGVAKSLYNIVGWDGRSGGGGFVIRDELGAYRGGASVFFPFIAGPEMAELLACREAIKRAASFGVQKLHIEIDCKGAVAMINAKAKNRSALGPLVEEIKVDLASWDSHEITWAS